METETNQEIKSPQEIKVAQEVQPQQKEETKEETINYVDRAAQIADRIENANKRAEELLAKNEAILSRALISGIARSGSANPNISKEQEEEERINEEVKKTMSRYF